MPTENKYRETEQDDLYEHHSILVDKRQSLLRIDRFLFNRLQNTSRTRIQKSIEAQNVRVNDKVVKSSYRVKPNERISVVLPYPPQNTELLPENIPIDVMYEDDEILIVNKPTGMVVHPGYNNYNGTLINAVLFYLNEKRESLPNIESEPIRPGLVHRIDKNTSGLLVLAKNELSHAFLAKQFFEHSIKRTYWALVWGQTPEKGEISGYIGRSNKDRKIMALFKTEEKGKWSLTRFRKLEDFGFCSLVECELETGRTHQIRAHFKSINHPIFGDTTYGGNQIMYSFQLPKFKNFIENCFKFLPHQALHAKTLGFIHPKKKAFVQFESPLPLPFQTVLDKVREVVG